MPAPATTAALLAEIDRQLGEQRAQADAFATRSGLLIAATAVLSGVLSGVLNSNDRLPTTLLWVLGGGAVAGVLVLCMSRIASGPSTLQLRVWMSHDRPADEAVLRAKLVTVEANSRALRRTEVMFLLQATATVVGVIIVAVQLRSVA